MPHFPNVPVIQFEGPKSKNPFAFKAKPLLNVHDIAVLSGHRGQGIGQALLNAAEDYAESADAASSLSRFSVATLRLCPATNSLGFPNTNLLLQRDKRNSCKSGCKVTG